MRSFVILLLEASFIKSFPALANAGELGTESLRSSRLSSSSKKEHCVKFWEWTLDGGMGINGDQYYGFALDGSTGTFTLPMYDNKELQGDPVARLRGSMITDHNGIGFTANTAVYFYSEDAYLGAHLSYTYDPNLVDDFVYGFTDSIAQENMREFQLRVSNATGTVDFSFTKYNGLLIMFVF